MNPPKGSNEESSIEESSTSGSLVEASTLKCESCDYSCLLEDDLQQHLASVHEGKKPLKCEFSDYSCLFKDDLQQYVASVHEGKKPFKCESYDYTRLLKDKIQQHIASIHERITAGALKSSSTSLNPKSTKICKSTWNGT